MKIRFPASTGCAQVSVLATLSFASSLYSLPLGSNTTNSEFTPSAIISDPASKTAALMPLLVESLHSVAPVLASAQNKCPLYPNNIPSFSTGVVKRAPTAVFVHTGVAAYPSALPSILIANLALPGVDNRLSVHDRRGVVSLSRLERQLPKQLAVLEADAHQPFRRQLHQL